MSDKEEKEVDPIKEVKETKTTKKADTEKEVKADKKEEKKEEKKEVKKEDKKECKPLDFKMIGIICVAVVAIIAIVVCVVLNSKPKGIKGETITSENYSQVVENIGNELKDSDDLYYVAYSITYHIIEDGLSTAFFQSGDENEMYKNIYGKTVQQLIDEGKKLMEEQNISLDDYKKQMDSAGSLFQK